MEGLSDTAIAYGVAIAVIVIVLSLIGFSIWITNWLLGRDKKDLDK